MDGAQVYKTMLFDEYLQIKGASKGVLNKIATSTPIECYHYMNKEEANDERKSHLALGSIFHALVLEPDTIERDYLIADKPDRRTKAGKEAYADIMLQCSGNGRTWVTPDEFNHASKMAAAVLDHELASRIVCRDGDAELTITWERQGVPCRARFDFLTHEIPGMGRFGVDLKTCRDLSRVYRDHYDYGYDLQFMHYSKAALAAGIELSGFIFIFVDSSENACKELVRVIDPSLSEEYVELAQTRYDYAFNKFRDCWHSGVWPGYQAEFEPMQYEYFHEREIAKM